MEKLEQYGIRELTSLAVVDIAKKDKPFALRWQGKRMFLAFLCEFDGGWPTHESLMHASGQLLEIIQESEVSE